MYICAWVYNACYCCFLSAGSEVRQAKIHLHWRHYFKVIFKKELGKIKDIKAKVRVQEGEMAKFFKPRPVPYALV